MKYKITTTELTQWELQAYLHYDPNTGIFTWLQNYQIRFVGRRAGNTKSEYEQIHICGKAYPSHVLAWLYMTGSLPKQEIDHKDLNPRNNRWDNLRLATRSQNAMNCGLRSDNTTGYKGVSPARGGYIGVIYEGGKRKYLGKYNTPEEASVVVERERLLRHGEFARKG